MKYLIPLLIAPAAFATTGRYTPTSLKLQVYQLAVSTDPYCTNLQTVVDNGSSPSQVDFASGTINLGSGTIPNGTYNCVAIEISDQVQYTIGTGGGNCTTGTTGTLDVCRSGDSSTMIDGTTTSCTSGTDKVTMYLSTASTSTTGVDAFNPPTNGTESTKGFNLANALVVSGDAIGKFTVNPTDKVCDKFYSGCDGSTGGGSTCSMEPPLFSFSQVQ